MRSPLRGGARRLLLVPLLLAARAATAQAPLPGDEAAVRDTFSKYRAAVLTGEGEIAAAMLSRATIDYFGQMRDLALRAPEAALRSRSLVDQMQALLLRLRVPAAELRAMSPQQVVVYAIDHGWVGKNSLAKTALGTVQVQGPVAVAHAVIGGQDAGPAFRFVEESRDWRLDLISVLQAGNEGLARQARQEGIAESEMLLTLVGGVLGHEVGPEAWTPPPAP